ncbi:cytochrome P450 [Massilia forsythiae]|nr:cytochrome P450 [Massilia forsythiae]
MAPINSKPAPNDVGRAVPHARGFDNAISLLREGYRFMPRRFEALGADAFTTRLMLRKVLCVRGEDGARMFYQPGRFRRKTGLPPTALALLQDFGSVTTHEGDMHRQRKAMFMSLFGPHERQRLVDLAAAQWRERFDKWRGMPGVIVHHEAEIVLCRAVCQWAGIPIGPEEATQRAREFSAMVDGAASVGPRNWKALLIRTRTEHWARALIDAVRAGTIQVPLESPLSVIARHRDADGELLRRKHAAVELINLLRPTVAVSRFIAFGVLALHQHPQSRARLAEDDTYLTWFAQEVRRYYPFIPAIGGVASHDFDWHGMRIAKGTWVLIDLYGTDHHPASWGDPETFRPERFERWESSGFDLIPQGGGDHYAGHRCPGEFATLDLVKSALRLFATEIDYAVPPQDLTVSLRRMPTLPASGMVIRDVRPL